MRLPDFPPLSVIKNRLVPGHWDVLAFLLVITFFIYLAEAAHGLTQPLARLEATWKGRADGERSQQWIDRQLRAVQAALKAMSQGLGEKPWCCGNHFTLADIAVGCALGYLDFRFPQIDWRTPYPNLQRLHEKVSARQSFVDSAPPTA